MMRRKLLILVSALLLNACFGGGETIPQDQFYRLSNQTYADKRLPQIAGVIAVSVLDSDVLHRERSILFNHADEPLKLQRYHYHHWTHIPSRLIQDNLVDYLRTTGIAREVIRYGEQASIDAEIGGQLRRFERVIGRGAPAVAVELELYYRSRHDRKQTIQRVYTQQVTASDDSMHATADAFSEALARIYQEFVRDIKTGYSS